MDNLAVANILPSPVVAAVVAGQQSPAPSDGVTLDAAFGDVLARQLALLDPHQASKNTTSELFLDPASAQKQAPEVIQPIDIVSQIIDPVLLAQQSAAPLVIEQATPKVLLPDAAKEDDVDALADQLASGQEVVSTTLNLVSAGNLQPALMVSDKSSGKDLPVSVGSVAVNSLASSSKFATTVESSDAESAEASAAFASRLEAAIATDSSKQNHPVSVSSSSNVTSPAVERLVNSAPTSAGVPQQVGSPHWDTGLGDKVVWMIGSQTQSAQLHLNPPNLGPLEIKLSMSDGQANLSFVTQHVAVRDAIEAASPRLREMMGDSGINMGSVSVNVGSFTQQQADQQQGSSTNSSSKVFSDEGVPDAGEQVTVSVQSLDDQGLVNLFA